MDRLSRLPEEVQSSILPFLSLKDLARVGFTCKTWWQICFSQVLMNMEFGEELFVEKDQSLEIQAVQREKFLGLIRSWLRLYQPPRVQKLSISLSNMPNAPYAATIVTDSILFARAKQVETYSWDSSNPRSWSGRGTGFMPIVSLQLLNYANLETLKLFSCSLNVVNLANFRSLRNLLLGKLELREPVLEHLLNECSCLENLSLKRCWNVDPGLIRGLRLRSLTVEECEFRHNELDLGFSAPVLRFLHYSGDFRTTENLHRENMEELHLEYGLETDFNPYGDYLFHLIQQHSHIRALTVDSYILQILPTAMATRFDPPLELRCLKWITGMHEYEFFGYSFFLKDCPLMETLIIQIKRVHILDEYEAPQEIAANYWDGQNMIVPPCMRDSLKFVVVEGFKGTMNEIKFLSYVIKYGFVMTTMTLKFPKVKTIEEKNWYASRARLLNRVNVPRASPELRIFTERD